MILRDFSYKDFPLQTYDKIRFCDTDRQGHVNNAIFPAFLETGRLEFLYDSKNPVNGEGCNFVIAGLKLDLIAEIKWPGNVEIGTGVTEIGNSSIHLAQGLYQNNKLVAVAQTVIVQIDNQTKKSKPLSDHSKSILSNHMIRIDK